jgi:hypothetical protein
MIILIILILKLVYSCICKCYWRLFIYMFFLKQIQCQGYKRFFLQKIVNDCHSTYLPKLTKQNPGVMRLAKFSSQWLPPWLHHKILKKKPWDSPLWLQTKIPKNTCMCCDGFIHNLLKLGFQWSHESCPLLRCRKLKNSASRGSGLSYFSHKDVGSTHPLKMACITCTRSLNLLRPRSILPWSLPKITHTE